MMMGREVATLVDIMYKLPGVVESIPANKWVLGLQGRMEDVKRFVQNHVNREMLQQKQYNDKHLREINTSPRPFSSTASNIQREVSTNPFLFPTQSKSDSAIATITREKSCESDEIIKMRQELEALRNENLQKSYESEEMVKMRQELEALRNFKNLQMKNNAQHFTESKSDPVIRSPNSYAETQQRSANSCNNTTLPETQQRSTNSCNNITLPETQQRPTYSYNTTTLPDTQQQQSYAYANMTIPEIQHRPNYSGTSTIMPEIQQRTDYEQYPNNSSVSNWLPRQQYGRPQQQYGRPQQQYHNIENSKIDNGRRNRVPFYNGRDPWSAYFMQFELIAEINRWDTDTKAIELVTALKDEAMVYASYLSPETKRSFFGLCAAMSNRFGDHGYPETYRQELHTLRKQGKENIHEYASRVEMLVRRSFPTIDVATHSTLSVEYMLRGLPDQSIAIELLTKRITSMTEAIHQVTLYETYKRGNKDRNIRQLSMQETVDFDEGEDDIEIRKVGGKRYVTEERLTQFERGITQSLGEIIQKEMTKFNKPNVNQGYRQNQPYNKDNRTKTRTTRCFNCNEEGHYIKDCKKPKKNKSIKDITTRNGPCGDEFDALTHDLSLNLLFEGFDELQKSTPSDVIGSAEPSQAIEKNIVIDRVRAATITVPLVINKVETKAVIDTGAEVTVLSEELYSKIPKDMRPELKKATRNLVVAEAGKHMTTRGIAQIEMKLGNEIFTWPMYVAPIGDNVLLGCDLIDEKDITINCKRGLQLNGEWIECQTTRQIDGIARVRIKEAITIPANSEIIIAGEGYDTEGLSSRYSILEPVVEDSRKIMVASTHADMCEYIGNITSASYKGNQTDKVDVQMLPELLQHATEDNLSVTDENVPVTEEIVNVIVTEEDGNMFCQEEKISQLKEGLHKTDLDQTTNEFENEEHVTRDTQKDWRKRKKRRKVDTEAR
ncbi:unnamed protein product [Mytilus edulis]|uniref:CCHC-type domain-containing protein n=1 Tax=Mytilus edulis TaxID=6550 RepID=A0A8S3T353_MYTED|nr:unnamed protein product [Mytilus edulis]